MTKVAITGIGAITPLGNSYSLIAENLVNGNSGISFAENSSVRKFPTYHAGYIKDFRMDTSLKIQSRLGQFSILACKNAMTDSRVNHNAYHPTRKSLIIGSEPPSIDLEKELYNLRNSYADMPLFLEGLGECGLFPETILSEISHSFGLRGRSYFHLGTCSAAAQAIGEGKLLIERGISDFVMCGGASSRVDPLSMLRLIRVGALAPSSLDNPEKLSMPFDKKRQGFTMSEGAVIFTLEKLDKVLEDKRIPYAVLLGYGGALDAYSITDPHPEELGMKLSMTRAIENAGITKEDINYINAHGTSTQKNDFHETRAINSVFGDYAKSISLSSTKSMHGHLMSAAGAIELLASIVAVREGVIPPTINLDDPDPDCYLNYTPNHSVKKNVNFALSNSFGLGGQNASLIVERFL